MQLLVYAWMWKKQTDPFYTSKEFKLVNIRTGEVYILDACSHLIDEAMHILLENKYGKKDVLSDAEFVELCARATSKPASLAALSLPAPCKSSNKCLFVEDDDENPVNVV